MTRDVGQQSNIGVIYTDFEFMGGWNRIGGIDGMWKLNSNWSLAYRGVLSSTQIPNGAYSASHRMDSFIFSARGASSATTCTTMTFSPGFQSKAGFINRNDIRRFRRNAAYSLRPEGKHLISWGPQAYGDVTYDHKGIPIEYSLSPGLSFELSRQTYINASYAFESDTLRPKDFAGLTQNRKFSQNSANFNFSSQPSRQLQFSVSINDGGQINVVPPAGQMPVLRAT